MKDLTNKELKKINGGYIGIAIAVWGLALAVAYGKGYYDGVQDRQQKMLKNTVA